MTPLHVEVVAPDRTVWEGTATAVAARGVEGDLGLLPGHAPMMTALGEGEVRIDSDAGRFVALIGGGFLSVDHDKVTIVAESVESAPTA